MAAKTHGVLLKPAGFWRKPKNQMLFRKAKKPIAFSESKPKQKKPWSRTRSRSKDKDKDKVKGLDSLRYLRGAIASEPDPPALHAAGCRSSAVDVGVNAWGLNALFWAAHSGMGVRREHKFRRLIFPAPKNHWVF